METIFNLIGYSISTETKNASNVVNLLSINNPDGSPRWIWNAKCSKPLFLKFYNVGSNRAFAFSLLIKIVFIFKLQKLVFKKRSYSFSKLENSIIDLNENWALFTGTVGPNNKGILYANNCFYKIATTPNARNLIKKEFEILQKLNNVSSSFEVPVVINYNENILQLSDISTNGKRIKNLSHEHINTISELNNIETNFVKISNWQLFQNLKNDFIKIDDQRIPKNMIRKINGLLNEISENKFIELTFSHGDFTQWNLFEKNNKLAIYDFELASCDKPKGFDFFHFMIQNSVLVNHKSWKKIIEDSTKLGKSELFNDNVATTYSYLKWYLLINCMHYLKVYSEQKEWHLQIDWLLKTWNEALNTFLTHSYSPRQLIIMDLFDSIQNQEYAALKFQNGFPEKLDLNSDIDLIIDKKNNLSIVQYLKNHTLVSKITIVERSFMNTIQVFTIDGEMLSLDLIWKLKRRNLELFDAKKLISRNIISSFGVKNASNIDTARYLVLFYILNNSKIPAKYLVYEQAIQNSKKPFDLIIKEYFVDSSKNRQVLLNFIEKNKQNKGTNYLKNTINYLVDTVKNLKKNNGFTITFSGVDGAGKSTVIENIAYKIEKQLRKPVIILRHRPSVLPILSVWTKGKEKAHQDTISSLPRQGKNASFISSMLRFSYYYFDYLFGQFVIYFKYISRGYVVIYDRYYFDFINDSKRSNIVLPKSISKLGYLFLLKPKFNFFLFADANVILNRKKELTKETIEELTNNYSSLFNSLRMKSKVSIYESINNEELDVTLNHIVKTIIQA
ncbi:hypothetical protein [Flavobacterium sp.]|uniref:hypothetical protein n=1 Tax=Flavobacterium sp. TaxID=239 RepID=UPI002629C112|nr:hypothetical protein [Flavobacterium sp.]